MYHARSIIYHFIINISKHSATFQNIGKLQKIYKQYFASLGWQGLPKGGSERGKADTGAGKMNLPPVIAGQLQIVFCPSTPPLLL